MEDEITAAPTEPAAEATVSKNQRHRKEKPWDHDGIDHWKMDEFKAEEGSGAFLEESSFATLFPQYREKYLRDIWPVVTSQLKKSKVDCVLNVVEGSMTVKTTRQTRDPFAIVKARDMIKLLARSVPVAHAVKIMDDAMQCDIIKIGGFVHNKDRFVKRRDRLIGPKGSTLKALELLTDCYILVQGNTVACMGGYKGLKQARRVIEDCMSNVHPVYSIKTMMIKRELEKDPKLKEEIWDRFLPKFKRKNVKKKKTRDDGEKAKKKAYTPFPPLPTPSKVDLQLESGEYFMNESSRRRKKIDAQKAEGAAKAKANRLEKDKESVPPDESGLEAARKRGRDEQGDEIDVQDLASRVKKKAKKAKRAKRAEITL